MAATSSNQASPLVHAIGGSLGSALALLLFYPLERARIELQSHVANQSHVPIPFNDEQPRLDSVQVKVDLGEASPALKGNVTNIISSGSWSPIHNESFVQTRDPRMESDDSWDLQSSPSTQSNDMYSEKAVQQVSKSSLLKCLVDLHGKGSLYQGVTPVVTTIFASQFVFFFLHAYIKRAMQHLPLFGDSNTKTSSTNALRSLISSCIAGIGNVLLTNPLWVANMAIVTGEAKTSSLFQELVSLLRSRGLLHLWSGTTASILLVSNPVIQFFSYEQLKHARLHNYGDNKKSVDHQVLPPIEAFVVGAIAKTIATVATYPLQLTQTVLRLVNNGYKGIVDCLIQLYRRAGYKEWYTGMRAKLLQTVLTAAFTFLTYEQILGAVQAALLQTAGRSTVAP